MNFDFANKTILVTGSNRGIGKSIGERFLECNGQVVFHMRENTPKSEEVINSLKSSYGEKVDTIFFDLDDLSIVEEKTKELLKRKSIDVLVNNAGVTHNMIMQMSKNEELFHQYSINVYAPFKIMQLVTRKMSRNKTGSVVNISSTAAYDGNPGKSIYGSTKAALIAITKSASRELGPMGIRVNSIAPGITETEMLESMTEEVINESLSSTDLRRAGRPEEIANAVLFLASDNASYITGQTIRVDGGM